MAENRTVFVDPSKKNSAANVPPVADSHPSHDSMDAFFNQIQSEMRRSDLSQEAVAAAFQAIQQMAHEGEPEKPMAPIQAAQGTGPCTSCGTENPQNSRFCNGCGSPLQTGSPDQQAASNVAGQHHYHHHYHHHYFPNGQGTAATVDRSARPVGAPVPIRDSARLKTPIAGAPAGVSRAEAALRTMTQDWVQACNTKHLDDLLEFYAADALVLRPNVPPVRGAAAIREFFFGALEAGLGEVELEPLRVELMGEVAYEAGRCKMLVPVAMGKRREERGKYMIMFSRQNGEWKAVADTWSSDLSIAGSVDTNTAKAPRKT
jgi:ketosteroid isomerase-like protein